MNGFEYYTPTKVIFGKDSEQKAGELIKELGCKKVMILYGSKSERNKAIINTVGKSLDEHGITYTLLGEIVPNPRLEKVREGIQLCRRQKCDFLLAIGGGSVIDTAKAIGYGCLYDGDVWDIYIKKYVPTACLPNGAIVTIPAAGSEMSNSSVITNEEGWLKRGYGSDLCRCKFAIMNPELTYSLPLYQTESGCVDIMMHTLERFFSKGESMELTDALSISLLDVVKKNALKLINHPDDYAARAETLWAGSLSHNGLTGCGISNGGDWACHQIEHELGGMFDIAHGAGLAAIWGSWAKYVWKENPARFAQLGYGLFQLDSNLSYDDAATETIKCMEDLFSELHMPINLTQLDIILDEAQLDELAYKCTFFGKRTIGSFKVLGFEDIKKILKAAI